MVVAESSIIIEDLDRRHPGLHRWIPDGDEGLRVRLLAHPAVARCVEDARPVRHYFPLSAPDHD